MPLECLDTLIGLDSLDCDCFTDDRPESYNTSTSGYYLTDEEFGVPLRSGILANTPCDETIWSAMARARTGAIADLKNALRLALSQNKERGKGWRGLIGKIDRTSALNNARAVSGVAIQPCTRQIDRVLVINAIYAGFTHTGTVDVTLNSNNFDYTNEGDVFTLNTVANRFERTELDTPIEIPLYDLAFDCPRYYFSYDSAGNTPLQSKLWCCGGATWKSFIQAGGFTVDALNTEDEFIGTSSYGLAFEGYIDCADLDWMCRLEELNGYNLQGALAHALLFKASARLLSILIESDKVNYYTLMDSEAAFNKRRDLNARFQEYINWIAQNLPAGYTSCWGCSKDIIKSAKILV